MHTTASGGVGVTAGMGLYGGMPSCPNYYGFVRGTGIREALSAGRVPSHLDEIEGEVESLPGKSSGAMQGPEDVYVMHATAGAGYGDPIRRDPAAVLLDVALGRATLAGAERMYGVRIADGEVEADRTRRLRAQIAVARLERAEGDAHSATRHAVEAVHQIGAHFGVVAIGDSLRFTCTECGNDLADARGNYKDGCRFSDRPLEETNMLAVAPEQWVDAPVVLREFYCPGCATILDSEMTSRGAPSLRDTTLHDPSELFTTARAGV
jgi:N-methylhydantoinase B